MGFREEVNRRVKELRRANDQARQALDDQEAQRSAEQSARLREKQLQAERHSYERLAQGHNELDQLDDLGVVQMLERARTDVWGGLGSIRRSPVDLRGEPYARIALVYEYEDAGWVTTREAQYRRGFRSDLEPPRRSAAGHFQVVMRRVYLMVMLRNGIITVSYNVPRRIKWQRGYTGGTEYSDSFPLSVVAGAKSKLEADIVNALAESVTRNCTPMDMKREGRQHIRRNVGPLRRLLHGHLPTVNVYDQNIDPNGIDL